MVNTKGHFYISGGWKIFDSVVSPGTAGIWRWCFKFSLPNLPVAFCSLLLAEPCWNGRLTYKNRFLSLELHQEAWCKAPNPFYPILKFPKSSVEGSRALNICSSSSPASKFYFFSWVTVAQTWCPVGRKILMSPSFPLCGLAKPLHSWTSRLLSFWSSGSCSKSLGFQEDCLSEDYKK